MARAEVMSGSPSPATAAPGANRIARLLPPIALVLATFGAFAPVLSAEFLAWDDDQNFLFNRAYRGLGWDRLEWMFTTFHMGPYQPLSWLTLGVDHELWGMDARGYHATNVLIHALTAVALYFVARRLYALWRGFDAGDGVIAGLAAAGVFALHPLRVESVAWVTERRDVLSGLFFVLAIGAWIRYGSEGRRASYWAAFVLIALSLGAKAVAIVAPALFLLLDVWPLKRTRLGWKRLALDQVPFAAASAVFGWLAIHGQASQGLTLLTVEQHGLAQRVAQAAYALAFYPWRTLVPLDLIPLYEMPVPFDPFTARFMVPFVLVVALTVALVAARRRAPALLAAWLAFVIVIAPVCGLTQAGRQLVADRYSYMACVPFSLLAGGAALLLLRARPAWRVGIVAGSGAALIALGVLTFRQSRYWQDSESLWGRTVAIEPRSPNGLLSLGSVLMRKGAAAARPEDREALYAKAESYFERGLASRPLPEMHVNLACVAIFRAQDHPDRSREFLDRALDQARRGIALGEAMNCVKPEWRLTLASALLNAGRCAEAVNILESLLPVMPDVEAELRSLSLAYACVGRNAEALGMLERALVLEPDSATLWLRAGDLNRTLGRIEEARVSYENVVALRAAALGAAAAADPDHVRAARALEELR